MRTHLKKHKAVKKKVFYFYQNNTPMHLAFQSMYLIWRRKCSKTIAPPPPDTSRAGMGPGHYQQTFKKHGYLLPAKFW